LLTRQNHPFNFVSSGSGLSAHIIYFFNYYLRVFLFSNHRDNRYYKNLWSRGLLLCLCIFYNNDN